MVYFEKKYTKAMARAILSQIKVVESVLLHSGINAARKVNDFTLMNEQVSTVIRDMYKTIGLYFANDTYRGIRNQVKSVASSYALNRKVDRGEALFETKGFGFNMEWANEIINYFRLYLLNQAVVPITETTKEFIRQVLEEGELNGWGVDQMAYKLTHSDLTLNRARLIVRTESAKAAFKGREMAKDKLPYQTEREWIAADDHRTRHSHRLVDGQKVEEGKKFLVPRFVKRGKIELQVGFDMMLGPGDLKASKENVINCRCTTVDRIVFKDGEPVMKQGQASEFFDFGGVTVARPIVKPQPVQTVAKPIYRELTTVKDAEEWAKQNLKTKVESYKGFDINTANEINRALFESEESIKSDLNISLKSASVGRSYAKYDWNTKTIEVKKNYSELQKQRQDDNTRWSSQYGNDYHVGTDINSLIKHEIGHALDDSTKRSLYRELELLPIDVRNKLYGISGYASTDRYMATGGSLQGSEMVAEVISAKLTNSMKYHKLPNEAKMIIDKYFK